MTTAASARPGPSAGGPPAEPLGSRARRVAVIASAVALLATVVAYASSMTGASNTALGVRSVEWLRDNGAAGIVAQIETWYYSLTAPAKGGPALNGAPQHRRHGRRRRARVPPPRCARRLRPPSTGGHDHPPGTTR